MLSRIVFVVCLLMGASAMADGLKVGMSMDYPPLTYKDKGNPVGIEADNVAAASKISGLEMQIVELPFDRLIPALEAGEIDVIMTGMSITPERSERIYFIQPYMDMGQMAITTISKAGNFVRPWAIYREGLRVGVEPGTTGAQFAERKLTEAKVAFYENPDAAFAGLRADEIDVYIHDAPTSWLLATSGDNGDLISLYHPLTEESLAWAVRKDDTHVAEILESALAAMKSNGTLRYILNRWIPVTVEVK